MLSCSEHSGPGNWHVTTWAYTTRWMSLKETETSWSCLCKRHWRKKKQNMPELSLSLELLNCARASGYCSIPVLFLYKVYTEPKWFKIIFLVIIVRNTHLWRKGLDLPTLSTWYSHCLWKSPSLCQDTPIKLGGKKEKKHPLTSLKSDWFSAVPQWMLSRQNQHRVVILGCSTSS